MKLSVWTPITSPRNRRTHKEQIGEGRAQSALVRRIRKVGNSLVITIPLKEAARLEVAECEFVTVEIRKAIVHPEISPEVRAALERVFDPAHPDMRYLQNQ